MIYKSDDITRIYMLKYPRTIIVRTLWNSSNVSPVCGSIPIEVVETIFFLLCMFHLL